MRPFALAVILAAAAASLAPPTARAADQTVVHLTETATRTMAPDRLRATLHLEAKAKSAREAQAALNRRMTTALAQAKAVAAVVASTGSYNVYRSGDKGDPAPWQANEALVLVSGDFAAVLGLSGDLQNAGFEISGLEFFVAPATVKGVEAALTQEALASLRARAEAVAKDLGVAIDHYSQLDIGNASGTEPIRPFPMVMSMARSAAMPAPAAQAGEDTITLSVSAEIVLAPAK